MVPPTDPQEIPSADNPIADQGAQPSPQSLPLAVPRGSPVTSPNYSLVVDSVEVVDRIETTSGPPILAPSGTKLVLVHTTVKVTGNAQDLTCGSDIFTQAYDSQGSEMAHVFEGPRIPGNPQCNYKTAAGETAHWNIAFKIGADRSPATMSVTDTNADGHRGWGDTLVAALN